MSSCTNSSNIRSTFLTQVIRQESDGKRVSFKINPADVGISAGVTVGSVIRYDATSESYDLSKADNPATAEVVGIVERVDAGVFTVVASGLIIYPNLTSVINSYTGGCATEDGGTGGGEGGNDILFLSDGCAGKLQLLEPTTSGRIVKPVMQRVKVGPAGPEQYNGIVLNYIGYQVSEAATFFQDELQFNGNVEYGRDTSSTPEGFIRVDQEQLIPTSSYPDLYETFGTQYSIYEETVTLPTYTGVFGSLLDQSITQKTGSAVTSRGTVVNTNQSNKTVTIRKTKDQPKTDSSKLVYFGNVPYQPSSSSVTAFTLPSVAPQKIKYSAGGETVEETLIPYMRTKSITTSVSIPKTLQIDEITSDKITTGGYVVGTKLADLEARVASMERRYGIIY